MVKNSWGIVVQEEWEQTAILRATISLDAFVVMPNHIHGIVVIDAVEDMARHGPTPTTRHFAKPIAGSLSTIVGGFKSAATKRINRLREERTPLWQGRYHEHIIRSETDLNRIRAYIEINPQRWSDDALHRS